MKGHIDEALNCLLDNFNNINHPEVIYWRQECEVHLSSYERYKRQERMRIIPIERIDVFLNNLTASVSALLNLIGNSLNHPDSQNSAELKVTLVINKDFDSFSEAEKTKILRQIEKILETNPDELKLLRIKRGSIKFEFQVTPAIAHKLYVLVKLGVIEEIVDFHVNFEKYQHYFNESPLNLSDTRLDEIKLEYKNLSEANLKKINLGKSNLIGINLIGSNLIEANLVETNLSKANLSKANLSRAILTRTKIIGAYLIETNLTKAILNDADLSYSYLSGADLYGCSLIQARLTNAYMIRTNLRKADLRFADLRESDLREADLSGTDLSGSYLDDARLERANMEGADLTETSLIGANLSGTKLDRAKLDNTVFHVSQRDYLLKEQIDLDNIVFVDDETAYAEISN